MTNFSANETNDLNFPKKRGRGKPRQYVCRVWVPLTEGMRDELDAYLRANNMADGSYRAAITMLVAIGLDHQNDDPFPDKAD